MYLVFCLTDHRTKITYYHISQDSYSFFILKKTQENVILQKVQMNKLTILHKILWSIFLFKIRNSFGHTPAAADNYVSV